MAIVTERPPAPSPALAEELISGIREPMLALDFGRRVSWANRPFYAAFGVKEGDGMYLPPDERVKIW